MSKHIDLTGEKFGLLTVLKKTTSYRTQPRYICKCDCGVEKTIRSCHLVTGYTKSCGCLAKIRPTKHGQAKRKNKSFEYQIWGSMIQRCHNSKNKSYNNFGARGIIVCERWRDFSNFLEDMGEKPTQEHSIDRIDVNGNYEPSNCRWATTDIQSLNKRLYRSNKSGYAGVYWHKRLNKWYASIRIDGKSKHLGMYTTKEDAISSRKEAEIKHRTIPS